MDIDHIQPVIDATIKWRQHLWEDHQVRDAPPSLGFVLDGDEDFQYVPAEGWMMAGATAGPEVAPMVAALLNYVRSWQEFTKFREIIFIAEAYGIETDDIDMKPENLGEDYRTNPDTKVFEQMTVTIAKDDLVGGCELASATIPYRITDGGVMRFDKQVIHVDDGKMEGNVIRVLREAFR